jgi:hypothetical protein
MKLIGKIALVVGITAFLSSCQKEDMPSPGPCTNHQQDETGTNMRVGGPENGDNGGGWLNGGGDIQCADSTGIVGGGDDDRDGGGVVGGGDDDRDGGRKTNGESKPR